MSLPIFHCIFKPQGEIEHFIHGVPMDLALSRENLYLLTIAKRTAGDKASVIGGIFVCTDYHHEDDEFADAMSGAVLACKEFSGLDIQSLRLLPARIRMPAGGPLTEDEMFKLAVGQYTKFSTGGSA